uniref:Cytochrome b5 heme-binding domain-containing protein n=1 Tax=Kalanchoe fedtschenkoi TaxID=63787 RepID=A0A7N0VLL2_KALFE
MVYDVTHFLDDHPGGDDPLLQVTGKDASDDFEDVGHSNNAKQVMKEYYIGDVDLSTMPAKTKHQAPVKIQELQQVSTQGGNDLFVKLLRFIVPIGLLAIAFGIRNYAKTL